MATKFHLASNVLTYLFFFFFLFVHTAQHTIYLPSHFPLQNLGPVISISLLTVISIDRYLTFAKQEFTCSQRSWYLKPLWLTLFAWVYGTSQNLPVFHSADVIPMSFQNRTVFYCTTTQGKTLSGRIYLMASVLLGFVIPLTTMVISYYRVIKVVWTRKRRLSSSLGPECDATITNAKLLERSRKRVLRVLLTVVICFVVCWLPFTIYHGILERYLQEPPNPMDAVRLGTYGVGLANSMCNPFIYYFNIGGKSVRSVKRRFAEEMGGRARTRSISVQDNSCHSRSAFGCGDSANMTELGFDQSNSSCLIDNISNKSSCVEFALTDDPRGSQEVIDTRL